MVLFWVGFEDDDTDLALFDIPVPLCSGVTLC